VQRDERHEVEVEEGRCPACGCQLDPVEVERGQPVCTTCDLRLERHLAAWLSFAAISDE